MGERGIDIVPLKGMAYGLMFERGGPIRPMADIDLLVRAADYQTAGEMMAGLGYEEVFQDPLSQAAGQHERQFVRDGRLVEVHRAFLRGRRITVDYDALWARTIPLDRDGVSCRRMSPEDTLLYHCFHMGMHEFALGGLRAVWELRRLILEDRPDLPACARRAREWETMRITWCALRLLQSCFPRTMHEARRAMHPATNCTRSIRWCDMRDGFASLRRELTPSPPLRILLEKFVIAPSIPLLTSPGPLPRPVQLLRKALLVDRTAGAVSYLLWYLKSNARLRLPRSLRPG
jgi:hypothetical protein